MANFFLHLLEEEVLFCGFFVKEDHPNYSMLEENLLAYFLYPLNTLFIGLSLLIKKAVVFIVKLSQQQLQNSNKKFNFSLTGKMPISLCLAVATETKTNEWTETELQLQLTWKPFKVLLVFLCKQVNWHALKCLVAQIAYTT